MDEISFAFYFIWKRPPMSKQIFSWGKEIHFGCLGVADFYLSRLLIPAFTWVLLVKLQVVTTGVSPQCSRLSPRSPRWCWVFNVKHVLKYFPELMHFNSLWLRTYFPVPRRVENKVLGWHLCISLTQFVIWFFFPWGTREFIGITGSIWCLCFQPFILNQCMSTLVLRDNTGDCSSLLLRWFLD